MHKSNNVIQLRDYRVVRDQAFEEGYTLKEYLHMAKIIGISHDVIIENSYKHKTLDKYLNQKEKKQRIKSRVFGMLAFSFLAYAANFGVMTAAAEIQAPKGFHQEYSQYRDSENKIRELEHREFMVSGQYILATRELLGDAYLDWSVFGPLAWRYEETKAKAINPLKHL